MTYTKKLKIYCDSKYPWGSFVYDEQKHPESLYNKINVSISTNDPELKVIRVIVGLKEYKPPIENIISLGSGVRVIIYTEYFGELNPDLVPNKIIEVIISEIDGSIL